MQGRQGSMPMNVMRGLWETEDDSETKDVMQELVHASMARQEDHREDGRNVPGINLPDLQLDFVQGVVKEKELKIWYRKVVSLWSAERSRNDGGDGIRWRGQVKDEVFLDEYARGVFCGRWMASTLCL